MIMNKVQRMQWLGRLSAGAVSAGIIAMSFGGTAFAAPLQNPFKGVSNLDDLVKILINA